MIKIELDIGQPILNVTLLNHIELKQLLSQLGKVLLYVFLGFQCLYSQFFLEQVHHFKSFNALEK